MAVVFPLSHCTAHCKSVCWSQDDRIAVTSSEVVYVLTLKGAFFTEKKSLKHDCPVVLTVAIVPTDPGLPPVPNQLPKGIVYNPELKDLGIFVDPLFSKSQTESFVHSEWSPVGSNDIGRCLLTCSTRSGRLYIYLPPSSCSTQWRPVVNLTDRLTSLLAGVQYDVTKISPRYSDHSSQDSGMRGLSTIAAAMYKVIEQHCSQRLLLATSAVSWLPDLCECPSSSSRKLAVLATATRTGHILLWGMRAPLDSSSSNSLDVLEVVKLPVASNHWVCGLKWSSSKGGGSSTSLAVGCTSGQVFCLSWSPALTLQYSEEGGSSSLPPPLLLSPHQLTTPWGQVDEMSVEVLAWSTAPQAEGFTWLILNKGPNILAVPVPQTDTTQYCLVSRMHSNTVSGIAPLRNGDVISCSLDGSLQQFTLPSSPCWSHDHHVINSCLVPLQSSPKDITFSAHGLAVSRNGLFSAVAINPNHDMSLRGKKFRCQVHLTELCSTEDIKTLLQEESYLRSWDVYECIRLHPTVFSETALSSSLAGLQLQRMAAEAREEEEEPQQKAEVLESQLLFHHGRQLLGEYLQWKELAGVPRDTQSVVSLRNTALYVKTNKMASSTDKQLVGKVLGSLKGMNSPKEHCPLCNTIVPFSNHSLEVCPQGHNLFRCSLTLCLSTEPVLSCRCSLCDATASFPSSPTTGSSSTGTWLSHVFTQFTSCPLCGGYFERLV